MSDNENTNIAALKTLGRNPIPFSDSNNDKGNNNQVVALEILDESGKKTTPFKVPDGRGVTVAGYNEDAVQVAAQEPKFRDIVIREDANPSGRILGYYNPPSLSPEYPEPQLVKLSWSTKIPLINGIPFWERLPEEPQDYYEAFSHYRDQDPTDPSNINNSNNNQQYSSVGLGPYLGVRLLHKTANYFDMEPKKLEEIAELWMWPQRVETYESFGDLLVQQHKAKKIKIMDSAQLTLAQKIREKAMEAFEALDIDRLSPNQIREYLKTASEFERLALGLPEHEPAEGNPSDNKKFGNNTPGIEVSGENQKVQIIYDNNWQSS